MVRVLVALATLGAAVGVPIAPVGQIPARADSSAPPPRGIRDRAELEAFIDGVITPTLRGKHIVGAAVAVVKDGALVFEKGYGFADRAKGIPVDPERTLFQIGSVSKLITWTAVMQLVEAGKLDLDRDVNDYLDFKIPATFPEPITLRHLMSHSAGFEEDTRGLITEDSTRPRRMGEWLASHVPGRARPPGALSAYSNFGTGLAGYIVQRVSGEPFPEYAARHIFVPLGMDHATAEQPAPPSIRAGQAVGYEWKGGELVPHGFEYFPGTGPAGAMSASAGSMAKFMIAHLQNGELGGQRILSEATAKLMHTRGFNHHPELSGWALGFYESNSHGLRIIGHGGDTRSFHTNLTLIPEERIGIYVSFNTTTGASATDPFREAFLDHYYPTPPAPTVLGDFPSRGARFAGVYLGTRRSYTKFLKSFSLAGVTEALEISFSGDSTLTMERGGETIKLTPLGPLLFRDAAGDHRYGFREDSAGRITHAFADDEPEVAFERFAWYQAPSLHLKVLGLGIVTFLAVIWAAVARRFRKRNRPALEPPAVIWGRRFLVAASLASVAFVVSIIVILGHDAFAFVFADTGANAWIVLTFPVVGLGCTIGALVAGVQQWRTGAGTLGARFRFSGAVVIAGLFLWSLYQWNLLGWRI